MRDYRDAVIEQLSEELASAEAQIAAEAAQWRRERAMLLDRLDVQRAELARLKSRLASMRDEISRYTSALVTGTAAA